MDNTVKHITQKEVLSWIRDKDPDDVVGYGDLVRSCPIANLLHYKYPKYVWEVGCYYVVYMEPGRGGYDKIEHRRWLKSLIFKIDNREEKSITAEMVKDILKEMGIR